MYTPGWASWMYFPSSLWAAALRGHPQAAARLARSAGSLGLPVYLYGAAASASHRRDLAEVRRGGYRVWAPEGPAVGARLRTERAPPALGGGRGRGAPLPRCLQRVPRHGRRGGGPRDSRRGPGARRRPTRLKALGLSGGQGAGLDEPHGLGTNSDLRRSRSRTVGR